MNIFFKIQIIIWILFGFVTTIISQSDSKEVSQSSLSKNKWGYVLSSSLPKFSEEYLEFISKSYEVLCINGLELNGKGQLRYTSQFINKISNSKLKSKDFTRAIIYPMITVSSIRDGIELLNSAKSRNKAVEMILEFMEAQSYIGIHLDIEYLPPENNERLAEFLKELKIALNEKKIKLSFAIFPQVDFSTYAGKLHNPEKIAASVNEVVLMSYDYRNKKTEAGCVTSLEWTRKNLTLLLNFFKPEQIWLGMPAYGYEWIIDSKKVNIVSSRDGEFYEKIWKGTREESGCVKIIKEDKKRESLIYFADEETRKKMRGIAEEMKIRGTSIWRLGLEEK